MLVVQRLVGHILLTPIWLVIVALMYFWKKYRIRDHLLIRRQYKELVSNHGPLLVCCNHLTLIDSVILHWAFGSLGWYLINYRHFLWNLPARENARRRLSWRFFTFAGKCLYIDRTGGAEHSAQMLDLIKTCLVSGDSFLIFPEGTRSRSGCVNVDQGTYGVGRIVQRLPGIKVLCVYLRGRGQENYSDFPAKHEYFEVKLRLIEPGTCYQGLRAMRDYSRQILGTLKALEDQYFENLQILDRPVSVQSRAAS